MFCAGGDVPKWLRGRFAKPFCAGSSPVVTSKIKGLNCRAVRPLFSFWGEFQANQGFDGKQGYTGFQAVGSSASQRIFPDQSQRFGFFRQSAYDLPTQLRFLSYGVGFLSIQAAALGSIHKSRIRREAPISPS